MTDFLHCFWVKCCQTIPEYGASRGKCLKGFHLQNYVVVKKIVESQVLAILMYRRRHVFSSLFRVSSLCQRQLAYILYESWLRGVFRVNTTLEPWTLILRSYIRGIYCVTMIYIFHLPPPHSATCMSASGVCVPVAGRNNTTSTSSSRWWPPHAQVDCWWKQRNTSTRCKGQDQHQCKLEQDAATTCNYNHHHHHRPDNDQHGCHWSAQCSNEWNLRLSMLREKGLYPSCCNVPWCCPDLCTLHWCSFASINCRKYSTFTCGSPATTASGVSFQPLTHILHLHLCILHCVAVVECGGSMWWC